MARSRSLLIRPFSKCNIAGCLRATWPRRNQLSACGENFARSGNYVAFTSERDAATELAEGTLRFLPLVEIDAFPQSFDIAIDASKPLNALVPIVADTAATVIEAALDSARTGEIRIVLHAIALTVLAPICRRNRRILFLSIFRKI